jgi:hypothetical protein
MNVKRGTKRKAVAAGAGFTMFGWLLLFAPWRFRSGVDAKEARSLPGDDLVAHPKIDSARAIDIEAPPSAVWPWLVQIGADRGGFYSYDALERAAGRLMKRAGIAPEGLDIHNATRVIPEWQSLEVGDTVNLAPGMGLHVWRIESERLLLLGSAMDSKTGQDFDAEDPHPEAFAVSTWAFILRDSPGGGTRLIVRMRTDYAPSAANVVIWRLLTEPVHQFMESRMLRGIRERAEGLTHTVRASTPDARAA